MTNIINLLEEIGRDPLQKLNVITGQSNVKGQLQDLDNNLLQFLQSGDISAAESYLGTRSSLVCGLHPAEEPANVPPAEEPDDDDKEAVQLRNIA